MRNHYHSAARRLLLVAPLIVVTAGTSLTIGGTPTAVRRAATAGPGALSRQLLPVTGAIVVRDPQGVIPRRAARITDPAPMLYEQYVPPPPPPPPQPAPVALPQPQVAPAGYVTINVPVYRQLRALNCETAALQMGLAYYGHYYSQDALFAYESPDLRAPVMGPNHTVVRWGDPYTNFVGNVNGNDYTPTGYGVYYPVILSIARSHGVPDAYGGEGYSPATIYAELTARHPVQVWVEAKWLRPRLGTWTAWDGRPIRYSLAEHSVTLSGVSATMVRVNDDLFGTQYWVSKATFETSWRDFNNMAVIFR